MNSPSYGIGFAMADLETKVLDAVGKVLRTAQSVVKRVRRLL
jgi:hypothetical protein